MQRLGVWRIFEQLNSRHRADIDGLRAAAVIPVVLYHAGIPYNSGGFLGVDIFFVISGFLITSILLREAEEGRFSILAFYNRRIRRIFPALFVLLFAVTAAALVLLAPTDLASYGRTLAATTVFASNVELYLQSGYFDSSSLEKPLLHTWSLAVEEQFYLVWPLVLWTVFKVGGRRALIPILAAGSCVSYLLAVIGASWSPSAVFYLPFTRAWELGLGATLAAIGPIGCSRRLREVAGLSGLLAIAAAIVLLGDSTPLFVASGVACVGTAALIACNSEPTLAGRFLSIPIFVGIGLISYSLYLWHWPLLAFAHYYYGETPPTTVALSLIVVAFIAATVSWFAVERPLRRPGPPRRAFIASAIVMTMLIAVAASIIATDGLSNRFPQIAALEAKLGRPAMCDGCHIGAPGEPQLVLWGDSHAAAISPSIRDVAHREKIPGVAFTSPGCPPLIGAQPFTRDEPKSIRCRAFQEHALASIEALPRVTTIILAGRWALATETTRFGDETRGRSFLRDSKTDRNSVTESRRAFAEALPRTVRALTKDHPKARILLIGQVPEPGFDPAECMIRAMMFDRDLSKCATVKSASRDRLRFSDSLIEQFAADDPQVGAIMLDRLTCASERCQTMMGITPLYRDVDHLSREGAVAVLRKCLTVAVQNESGCPTAVIP